MKQSERFYLVSALCCCILGAEGFSSSDQPRRHMSTTSRLDAVPPTLIIGPMIKKMREAEEKKRQPMAEKSEAATEAPGLKVGTKSWRWPPIWPYESALFMTSKQAEEIERKRSLEQVTSALSGVTRPMGAEPSDAPEEYDPVTFWNTEGAVETELDVEAAEKLREHFKFYLREDMSILELGAAEESYLPFKPARHVGVGLNKDLMGKNPSLTERMVVDLNKVETGRDVDDDDFRRLAQNPFDAVIMVNTIGYLLSPREVLRSAWYLLKPGGIMMVVFSTKGSTKTDFPDVQTRLWSRYNDDQHMWMTGSFFQFSAGEGWENLLGFDISPTSAKDPFKSGPMAILDRGKLNNIYVVQGTKGYQEESIDPQNPESSIRSLCWMLPTLEGRDKSLVVPRLAHVYQTTEDDAIRSSIEKNIALLPKIYEVLMKMDSFSFTFNMQAQLATDLLCDPRFTGSDEQMNSLKEGLGLKSPGKDFWAPVGRDTAAIPVEDKISLLAFLVSCFGSNDPDLEEALQSFVTGLKPTYNIIRAKCPTLSEEDVQLLGAELLAYEILSRGRTNRQEFALWLAALTREELLELLDVRNSYRKDAAERQQKYKQDEEERTRQIEELRAKMAEQKETARLTRSMYFNARSEKFEKFDNPNKNKANGKKWPFS